MRAGWALPSEVGGSNSRVTLCSMDSVSVLMSVTSSVFSPGLSSEPRSASRFGVLGRGLPPGGMSAAVLSGLECFSAVVPVPTGAVWSVMPAGREASLESASIARPGKGLARLGNCLF